MSRRQQAIWVKNSKERARLEKEIWQSSALICSMLTVRGESKCTGGRCFMKVGGEKVPGKKAEVKGGQAIPPQAMTSWPYALSCIKNQELCVSGVG